MLYAFLYNASQEFYDKKKSSDEADLRTPVVMKDRKKTHDNH